MSDKYVKLVKDGVAYYFLDQHYDLMCKNPYQHSQWWLMQFAMFAVDLRNNTILKCRNSIEDIIDVFTNSRS